MRILLDESVPGRLGPLLTGHSTFSNGAGPASRMESCSRLRAMPTMIEAGYRDFQIVGWTGLLVPAGNPRAQHQPPEHRDQQAIDHSHS